MRTAIYNELYNTAKELDPTVYVTSVYEPLNTKVPCVYITQAFSQTARAVELKSTDIQYRDDLELQIYYPTAKECFDMFVELNAVLKQMHFILDTVQEVPNKDTTVRRVVADFHVIKGEQI